MSEKAQRPRQATFAAWLIIGGSVVLVLTAWQRISTLHTLEVQEELQRVLSEPPLSGTGLGLSELQTTIRIMCMVAAAAATASAILGWHALRRSTSARLALTLLAPLVLVGGFATAGVFAPLVVAGVVMLWLRPTRDWFAGRPWTPVRSRLAPRSVDAFAPQAKPEPRHSGPPASSAPTSPSTPSAPGSPGSPSSPSAPSAPSSATSSGPGPFAGAYGAPLPTPDPAAQRDTVPAKRPGALIAACVIVWVSCTLVSAFMVLFSLIMAVARDEFFAEIERQQPTFDMRGMTEAELATGTFVMTGLVILWSLVAMVLAVLAFRRMAWARTALAVSTGIALVVLLGATLLSPFLSVLLVAAGATLWLLLRRDVTAWFAR